MRPKLLSAVAALAVCGAVALTVTGTAGARSGATTKVTIKYNGDGFQGIVKSSDPKMCADNRKVNVYKQQGNSQDPSNDQKLYSDTASKQNHRYRWNTGNSGQVHGRFYARAGKIPGCQPGSSPTIHT